MSRRFFMTVAIALGLLSPLSLVAMQTQTFDLASGEINAQWQGFGPIQLQKQADGILLATGNGTGMLLTTTQTAFLADAATVVASTQEPMNLHFVWIYTEDPESVTYSVPFSLSSGARRTASFSLANANEWLKNEKKIGLVLPPNTSLLLHRIDFHQWNWFERIAQNISAFWTLDEYRPYSINFTWGPQLASNPIERGELYQTLPPASTSATLVTYQVLLGILILIVAWTYVRPRGNQMEYILKKMSVVLLVAWILFDVRMGSEFLSWVAHDQSTYIGKSVATRTLRDRERFYDFAAFASPFVADRESYIFFAEQPWPYLGLMRYLTYPAIPGIDFEKDDTWVIYNRSDIQISPANQLTIDGTAISEPGTLLGRFDSDSFVFRVSSPQ